MPRGAGGELEDVDTAVGDRPGGRAGSSSVEGSERAVAGRHKQIHGRIIQGSRALSPAEVGDVILYVKIQVAGRSSRIDLWG